MFTSRPIAAFWTALVITACLLAGDLVHATEEPKLGLRWEDKVFREEVKPHWLPNSTHFWYEVETSPKTSEFILVETASGHRSPAFDHEQLAANLEKATGRSTSARCLMIHHVHMHDTRTVYFQTGRQWWQLTLPEGSLKKMSAPPPLVAGTLSAYQGQKSIPSSRPAEVTFHNRSDREVALFWLDLQGKQILYGTLAPGQSRAQSTYIGHVFLLEDEQGTPLGICRAGAEPKEITLAAPSPILANSSLLAKLHWEPEKPSAQSPDGQWTARIAGRNVELVAKDGAVFPLSTDGTNDDRYEGEFYWSPDSQYLVGYRLRPGEKHRIPLIESSPSDQTQPRLLWRDYLKPGDRIDQRRPCLFRISEKRAVALCEELWETPWSIGPIRWSADSQRFSFLYNQRGHQVERVVEVEAASGQARALIEEKSATFIDYSQKTFLHWLDQSGEILWMSERNGWNHLWRFDAKTGPAGQQITRGEWVVRRVERVDEAERRVWFWAGGVIAGQDPYYEHLCCVNLDGSDFRVLTEGDGTHRAEFSPDRRYFIDSWSRVDQPPVHELRRAEDGKLMCVLEKADDALLQARGWSPPERFHAPGRDGKTEIHGIIIKPSNFDPNQRYPVVEQIYAGPHGAFVPKKWELQLRQRELAERGFILVMIDGMGTNWRSKAFHDVAWKNLKDGGLPDRIAWMKAAAATRPWMDLERVGIYGGSAGGQTALGALLFHGDFYKVAVADCGCHDNRMDKIWWNEAWMGWPVGPEYADNSNVTHAHRLTGKLLLTVGELDDNVDPASTMQVVNALVKADKDFDLLVVPGAKHGAGESPYGQRRRADFLARHLLLAP